MHIAINKLSAVRVMRWLRAPQNGHAQEGWLAARADLTPPDPAPKKRWSAAALDLSRLGAAGSFSQQDPLDIAVPHAQARMRMKGVRNTVYARGLPHGAFLEIGEGVQMSSPELLFVETAPLMSIADHVLLGYELCGTYARDAMDPRDGPASLWIPKATSVRKIERFLDDCEGIRGMDVARAHLAFVSDDAWAPTESLISALVCLPIWAYGFALGSVTLNARVDPSASAANSFAKRFRRPDILIDGTSVGINYDGEGHLDLESVARAAVDAYRFPEIGVVQQGYIAAKDSVRRKVLDDKRRDRELGSQGYYVVPVTKEDLYEPNGFEKLIHLVLDGLEKHSGLDVCDKRRSLSNRALMQKRQDLLWSQLPGRRGLQKALQLERERQERIIAYGLRE